MIQMKLYTVSLSVLVWDLLGVGGVGVMFKSQGQEISQNLLDVYGYKRTWSIYMVIKI